MNNSDQYIIGLVIFISSMLFLTLAGVAIFNISDYFKRIYNHFKTK